MEQKWNKNGTKMGKNEKENTDKKWIKTDKKKWIKTDKKMKKKLTKKMKKKTDTKNEKKTDKKNEKKTDKKMKKILTKKMKGTKRNKNLIWFEKMTNFWKKVFNMKIKKNVSTKII